MGRLLDALRWGVAPLVGSGENRLSVVYVGSVIDALLAALERPNVTGPFNTTNDGAITQRQFFEILGAAMGKRIRFVRTPVRVAAAIGRAWHLVYGMTHPGRYTGVSSGSGRFLSRDNPYTSARATRELGWNPQVPAEEALRRTAEWFVRG
jgi:nucleoside-diphosphate-sugar epimerase